MVLIPSPDHSEPDTEARMHISEERFYAIGSRLNLSPQQLEAFWSSLDREACAAASTRSAQYLFYLGALIAIAAMTWFMNASWERFGGDGLFLIALVYAATLTAVGRHLWNHTGWRTPAALLITIAVCMTPLAIYGWQTHFNIWPLHPSGQHPELYPGMDGSTFFMALGTILAGLAACRFFPFPLHTAPMSVAAWWLAMEGAAWFNNSAYWRSSCWTSLGIGLILLAIGAGIDLKRRAYGFWPYLVGTLAFWSGLACLVWDQGEGVLFLFLLVNLLLIASSIPLQRNVLAVFGAVGVFLYLSHLAYDLFPDSLLFSLALSAIGLAIIYLGVLYQRYAQRIETFLSPFFWRKK